jgi:anti-sigma factor RsiW
MKMVNKTDNTCSFGGDTLAYLYDELSSDRRERFEMHLEGCSHCIDEFAELSEARYSVYEWKTVEFSSLSTPRFVIPAESAPASASWLDSIRAAFAWNGAAALAGGIAILVMGVFGFAVFINSPEAPVATAIQPPTRRSGPSAVVSPTRSAEAADVDGPAVEGPDVTTVTPRFSEPEILAVRKRAASPKGKPSRSTRTEPVQTKRARPTPSLDNSPTLGQYVDDRDESLRLSDLFDDLDSRELD